MKRPETGDSNLAVSDHQFFTGALKGCEFLINNIIRFYLAPFQIHFRTTHASRAGGTMGRPRLP